MKRLDPEQLRRAFDPTTLACHTSDEMPPLETVIGQQRAVKALQFGLGIRERGFNIYAAGVPGTGRTTAVKLFLENVAKDVPSPGDVCYVYNFQDSYRPRALILPPGRAREFKEDVDNLVEEALRELRHAFENEDYVTRREQVGRSFARKRNGLFAQLEGQASEKGFVIQSSQIGLLTIPVRDGKPLDDQARQALSSTEREALSSSQEELQAKVKAALRQVRSLEKQLAGELANLDQEIARYSTDPLFEELQATYQDLPDVSAFLHDVQDDMLKHLAQVRGGEAKQSDSPTPFAKKDEFSLRKYQVNVLVDNSNLCGAPVIIEHNPTYSNLFGWIEKEPQFGTLITDYTMIQAGSLHRANGGYLVIPASDLLRDSLSWESLKRSLRNEQATIEEPAERLGVMATKTLRPEPIPMNIKIVLIGDPTLYQALHRYDDDFGELFKVKADFDTQMERNPQNVQNYARFVCTLCTEEDLKHLESEALAKVVEFGSRLAQDQTKLSTQFGALSDMIREASYYADQDGSEYVAEHHIRRAIEEKLYRSNLVEERIQEMIDRGSIMIDTEGTRVGQVNGLSVLGLGDISFGRPSRITATTGLGRGGVVDIEREANLSGPLHAKGVMILSGYLTSRFAQDKPLNLSARLVFEQSYSGVDGDSASSTELYALLSSLSGVPIKQGIAVTGSVNQNGEVQAIGGVNFKIEGFYDVCKAKGLTGDQGVLIPASNVENLMLREDVVQAVQEGQFHVWAVKTIDEGIEVLTGLRAGERQPDGAFEDDTINALVDNRVRELAESLTKFGPPATNGLPG